MASFGNHTFDYDANGLRTRKNDVAYTYIGGKLIREENSGHTIDYIYGNDGITGIKYNGTVYLFRKNVFGDVTHIYDMNGELHARYIYDAWGNHTVVNDTETEMGTINPIRYRSYYYDTETKLYYLRARYYDPETGRFISQDNVSYLDPENLTGLNLYAYCNNDPVMGYDPSGCSILLTILGVVAILATTTVVGAASGAAISGMVYAISTDEFSWNEFGAKVAGGAVTGAITGLASGIMIITGGSASAVVGISAIAGAVGGAAGSLTESALLGKDMISAEVWIDAGFSFVTGAAFGALFGVMQGATPAIKQIALQKGRTFTQQLFKTLQHKVLKTSGMTLMENMLADFTSWFTELTLITPLINFVCD